MGPFRAVDRASTTTFCFFLIRPRPIVHLIKVSFGCGEAVNIRDFLSSSIWSCWRAQCRVGCTWLGDPAKDEHWSRGFDIDTPGCWFFTYIFPDLIPHSNQLLHLIWSTLRHYIKHELLFLRCMVRGRWAKLITEEKMDQPSWCNFLPKKKKKQAGAINGSKSSVRWPKNFRYFSCLETFFG